LSTNFFMPNNLIERVAKKANRIRNTKKIRKVPETLRESHAREFVARTVILRNAKKYFGKKLKAVLIYGSAQRGVRKASFYDPRSDLDIRFVVEPSVYSRRLMAPYKDFLEDIQVAALRAGIVVAPVVFPSDLFKSEQVTAQHPFQVIYGSVWVKDALGPVEMQKQSSLKNQRKQETKKYSTRNLKK